MSREDIKIPQRLNYVPHFSSGALRRRLGFLLELYGMASLDQLESLRSHMTSTYDRLDPMSGRRLRRPPCSLYSRLARSEILRCGIMYAEWSPVLLARFAKIRVAPLC